MYVYNSNFKTLGEFIRSEYPTAKIVDGEAPLEMDMSHGYEVEEFDNRKHGHGIYVSVHPFILWTDGLYKPCHYWGLRYCLSLQID